TPLDERREPDLSYVEQTAISIYPHLQKGQLVVLESTTTRAPPKSWFSPSWRKADCAAPSPSARNMKISPLIFSWPFRRNARIPETSSSAWHRFPRSLAD